MRQKYMFLILVFCTVLLAGVFLRIARVTGEAVPGGSDRVEFGRAIAQFVRLPGRDESPYYMPGEIVHPTPQSTLNNDESLVKAKVSDCQSFWPAIPLPVSSHVQPMVIRNARHTAVTAQMTADGGKVRRWTIAPGTTWKTSTNVGRRWLFTEKQRCLFYVTAGDEPLRMVVNTQS